MTFDDLYKEMLQLLPVDINNEEKRVSVLVHADMHILLKFEWIEMNKDLVCIYPIGLLNPEYLGEAIHQHIVRDKELIQNAILEARHQLLFAQEDSPQLQ